MRQPVFPALIAVLIGATISSVSARGQDGTPASTLSEARVPGGARAALAAIGDPVPADRSHLMLEVIRRAHEAPMGLKGTMPRRDAVLRPLLSHLDAMASGGTRGQNASAARIADTVPLPLSPSIWIDVILGGRATAETLVADILRSPGASLLYCGLLSLDDPTRAWLATKPQLLSEIATRHAAAFLVASPALHFDGTGFRLPGGDRARVVWESLVGRPSSDPGFLRAVIAERDGRLAYFLASMASLEPARVSLALNLDAPEAVRIESARRLYGVFQRLAEGWNLNERPFWRPALDPALLLSDLTATADGRASLPGNRAFWTAVFDDGGPDRTIAESAERDLVRVEPLEFTWLAEQIFRSSQVVQRRPYHTVLFASRVLDAVTRDNVRDAVTALRASGAYPALITTLERGGATDVATYARVVRRAAQLSDAGGRAVRAVAQFSGALAFLTRAAARGSLTPKTYSAAVSSLAAIELGDRGEYDGRIVRWFEAFIVSAQQNRPPAASPPEPVSVVYQDAVTPIDRQALRILAGDAAMPSRTVDWEGTRYRLDFTFAELTRLARVLGDEARPYLSSAIALLDVADGLRQRPLTSATLRDQSAAIDRIDAALRCGDAEDWAFSDALKRCRELAAAFQRAAKTGDATSGERLAPRARALADDVLARGFVELAYAVALGQPEVAAISAGDAASRHDFGLTALGLGSSGPWRYPTAGGDRTHDWHVTGSLLGLDVRLAQFGLMALSSKPPIRPSINDEDRQGIIESVALGTPPLLADADLQAIAAAMKKGRARAAAIRTAIDAELVATEIPLNQMRRTLLRWVAGNDPDRIGAFLSPIELLVLGGGAAMPPRLNAWGISGEARLGCLCLQLVSPAGLDRLSGRWYSGIFATGFGDLPLRLAELLAELSMPAALLTPVMASAALDFITNVRLRDADDRRGFVEFVHALRVDNMEQYLGLLTTDGPLVPLGESTGHAQAGFVPGSFVLLQ